MYVERHFIINLDGLVLRHKPYFQVSIVERALIGLSHGDDLLHRFSGRNEYRAAVGRHTVHENFQALLVSLLLYHDVIAEVEALTGGAQVGKVQRELSGLSRRYIAQCDVLGTVVGVAVETDADVGALHLLGAVADDKFPWLVVFSLLLAFVGVVALSANEVEAVAIAAGRLIDIGTEIRTLVAVAELRVKLCPFLVVLIGVAFGRCHVPAVLDFIISDKFPIEHRCSLFAGETNPECHAHLVLVAVTPLVGCVASLAVGGRGATVERDITFEVVMVSDRFHLVLLIVGKHLMPAFNLVSTPPHAVGEDLVHFGVFRNNLDISFVIDA